MQDHGLRKPCIHGSVPSALQLRFGMVIASDNNFKCRSMIFPVFCFVAVVCWKLIPRFLPVKYNCRIFGPTKERDGTWRKKTNDELNELIRHKNIINHTKAQRLSWFGHLQRMPKERMVKKVFKWKPMLTRPLGRQKNRWEDDMTRRN